MIVATMMSVLVTRIIRLIDTMIRMMGILVNEVCDVDKFDREKNF